MLPGPGAAIGPRGPRIWSGLESTSRRRPQVDSPWPLSITGDFLSITYEHATPRGVADQGGLLAFQGTLPLDNTAYSSENLGTHYGPTRQGISLRCAL